MSGHSFRKFAQTSGLAGL